MSRPVRIGNAHGFWGDRIEAGAEMLALEPDLDFVTFDFLAEVSMSILALQRSRNPDAGWPRDVLDVIRSLVPYWKQGGTCRMIANAGGLNPVGCARACQQILIEAGCGDRMIAVVQGDDVLDQLRLAPQDSPVFRNLDTNEPLSRVSDRLVTANAYLGAKPITDALSAGADIVITGRVADPSLTVAACAYFHGWDWTDWNRLAQATVAGHLIECGTQVTGGISTDWLDLSNAGQIAFPIVEVDQDGSFAVTKPRNSAGIVNEHTVKEQLVYEIGDPAEYLSPDVTVSFLSLELHEEARDRVRIRGAKGRPFPPFYKISATYQDGYRAQGQLTVYGDNAVQKARRAGDAVIERLRSRGIEFHDSLIECVGTETCHPAGGSAECAASLRETVLRIAVADQSRHSVEQFTREMMPLITAGPPGTTGYAEGRPKVHPVFRYWPCLIERDKVIAQMTSLEASIDYHNGVQPASVVPAIVSATPSHPPLPSIDESLSSTSVSSLTAMLMPVAVNVRAKSVQRLADIAYARSGDKGINANIGVIVRELKDYDILYHELTANRVAEYLRVEPARVTRYELPNLAAFNFIVRGILSNPLRLDAQGKTLGQVLLNLPLNGKNGRRERS